MKPGSFLRHRMTLIITLVSLCALVLVVGAARKTGNGRGKQSGTAHMESFTPRVQNRTRAFEVTRARRNLDFDTGPELSLRNGYDKNITAFAVSVNGLISLPDFVYSEGEEYRAITPGAVYTRGFGNVRRSVDRAVAARADAGREDFDIKVLAVVFDDNSSEGDEKPVAYILEQRLKSKRLLTRIVDLLSGDLNSLQTIDDAVLDELRSRISSLSSDPGDASDTSDVLRWLGKPDGDSSARERIVHVKVACESLIGRL